MPLTRDFKETSRERASRDAGFREALLQRPSTPCLRDVETGKTVLRNYINATVGFDKLATVTQEIAKEPHAYARPERQSSSSQFFEIVAYLQKKRRCALESTRGVELA